jgi:WD40 repeat protein
VLSLYEKILKGNEVFDDESNKLAAVLKLSGIVRVEERTLSVRNRIYERVFDRHWIRENMPGAELRRQRKAFLKGVVRTGVVAAAVVAVIGWLAWTAMRERDRANYEVYVATMNVMGPTWEQNNLERMLALLETTKDNPARGWEWDYWYRMAHLETATLPKRLVTTGGIRYGPNGKLYVREEGRIWEYSPETGSIVDVMPMLGHAAGFIIPFADGKRLLEIDGIQTAQVIDVAARRRLATLEDFNWWNLGDMVSPDGRWAIGARASDVQASKNCNGSAVLWDTETGKTTSLQTPCVRAQTISPDGRMIAEAELDSSGVTSIYHTVVRQFGTWKILAQFETDGPAWALRFSPGSDRLATGSFSGSVQVWDLKTHREISHVQQTSALVYYLEFSSDGAWLAVTSVDRIGRLYDVSGPDMKLMETFRDAGTLTIAPDKARVAASYSTLRLYDPKTYVETPTASSGGFDKDDVDVIPGKALARARSGDKAYELDPLTGQSHEIRGLPGKPVLEPESGESWGVVQRDNGTFEIADFDSGRSVLALPQDARVPFACRQFPDNHRVVVFYADKTIDVWDVPDRRLVKQLRSTMLFAAEKVSPDGRWLAVAYWGNAMSLWDTATWTERPFPRIGSSVINVTFSPDATRLLVAAGNDTIEVWDVPSATQVGTLVGHSQQPEDAAYSPDGRRIVTASNDRTVRIWDAATFRELTSFSGHNDLVLRARFTDDGRSIISIDFKGTAKLWLTKTPQSAVAK